MVIIDKSLLVSENGNRYESHQSNIILQKQRHIHERSAIFSQLKDELTGLSTSIQGVISYTSEMERFDCDENNSAGVKD